MPLNISEGFYVTGLGRIAHRPSDYPFVPETQLQSCTLPLEPTPVGLLPNPCSDVTGCGAGGSPIPDLPSDPSQPGSLVVESGFKGMHIRWTYPSINPHSVAHTRLYRALSSNFSTANSNNPVLVNGSMYFDSFNVVEGTTYFYWIQMVSVNGTVGDLIGPAYGTLRNSIDDIIDDLEKAINNSHLSLALQADINSVLNFASALGSAQDQIDKLGFDVFSQLLAPFLERLEDRESLIYKAETTWTNQFSTLAASIEGLAARWAVDIQSAVQVETAARAGVDGAQALQITTLSTQFDTQYASLQTWAEVDNRINNLSTQYYVKSSISDNIDNHPVVAGFGLYNSSTYGSAFIVHSDVFAIGVPRRGDKNVTKPIVYPFMIAPVDGEMTIALNAKTLIPDATITIGKIENLLKSSNYSANQQGWAIYQDYFGFGGYAEFQNIKARGDIEATSIRIGTEDIIGTLMLNDNAVTVGYAKKSSDNSKLSSRSIGGNDQPFGGSVQIVANVTVYGSSDGSGKITIYSNEGSGSTTEVIELRQSSGSFNAFSFPISACHQSNATTGNVGWNVACSRTSGDMTFGPITATINVLKK